ACAAWCASIMTASASAPSSAATHNTRATSPTCSSATCSKTASTRYLARWTPCASCRWLNPTEPATRSFAVRRRSGSLLSFLRRHQFIQRLARLVHGPRHDQDHALGVEVFPGHCLHVLRSHGRNCLAVVVGIVEAEVIALDLEELRGHAVVGRELEDKVAVQ